MDNNELKIEKMGEKSLDNSQTSITISKEEVKKIIEDNVRDLLTKDKSSLLTTFGIFASVLVFLSVQIQILQKAVTFDQLVFLSLLLLTGLLAFVIVLQWITKTWIENNNKEAFKPVYIILVVLFILLVFFGYISMKKENKTYKSFYMESHIK